MVLTEVASLKEGRLVMLQFNGEHGHVTEVASLMESMVMLRRWPV